MTLNLWLTVLLPLAGATLGFVVQQIIDVWKTTKTHQQELQQRFFDVKLKNAIDATQTLQLLASFYRVRLAEAEEWTRADEHFENLSGVQYVLQLHGQALEREFERYQAALALLNFFFPSILSSTSIDAGVSQLLNEAWLEFEQEKSGLKRTLGSLLPDTRMQELTLQRERGSFEAGAQSEIEQWVGAYKTGTARLRARIPSIKELTARLEQENLALIRALRQELSPFLV